MAESIKEQVAEWLTARDTCFLLGSGCSVCAKKPMIGELTTKVIKGSAGKLVRQFETLKPVGDRDATVEDLMNYLVRYKEILGTITNVEGHDISIQEIDEWMSFLKKKIIAEVADEWSPSEYHRRFLQRVRRHPRHGPRDIFTLNYDTVLEASLDDLRIPYLDGFRGTNRAWFDPDLFDNEAGGAAYRLYKLHGSINWTRDKEEHVRRGQNAIVGTTDEPIVVYPSEQKYLQTQYGVYETLMGLFRSRLRADMANNCLVILGYSFNDAHINEAICDAIRSRGSNLTVITFVGPEKDRERQNIRLKDLADRCDSRFNAFIDGGEAGCFIGHALDSDAAAAVLNANLWKFQNLVDLVT